MHQSQQSSRGQDMSRYRGPQRSMPVWRTTGMTSCEGHRGGCTSLPSHALHCPVMKNKHIIGFPIGYEVHCVKNKLRPLRRLRATAILPCWVPGSAAGAAPWYTSGQGPPDVRAPTSSDIASVWEVLSWHLSAMYISYSLVHGASMYISFSLVHGASIYISYSLRG